MKKFIKLQDTFLEIPIVYFDENWKWLKWQKKIKALILMKMTKYFTHLVIRSWYNVRCNKIWKTKKKTFNANLPVTFMYLEWDNCESCVLLQEDPFWHLGPRSIPKHQYGVFSIYYSKTHSDIQNGWLYQVSSMCQTVMAFAFSHVPKGHSVVELNHPNWIQKFLVILVC